MYSPIPPPAIAPSERLLSATYSLRPVNGHTLELTPTGTGFCLFGIGVSLVACLGWGVAWYGGWLPRYVTMMSIGMSTVATVIMAFYLGLRCLGGRVYFDNRTRTVRIKPCRCRDWNQWTFDDFLLVQITTSFDADEAVPPTGRKYAYQINLTYRLASGEVARFPLLIGNRKNVLKKRAKQLAEFMGLPLISETASLSSTAVLLASPKKHQ
jgi:hypothetical protein